MNGLKAQADVSFHQFISRVLSEANDAEFAVVLEGMSTENHTPDLYENALQLKLDEYKSSRVRDIGRKTAKDDTEHVTVLRETRVVWVKNYPGDGRKLYYQYQQAGIESFHAGHDDPGQPWNFPPWVLRQMPPEFGVIGGETKLGGAVPETFIELAIQRSEALYGETPTIDPVRDKLKSVGLDPDKQGRQQQPDAANSSQRDLKANPTAPDFMTAPGPSAPAQGGAWRPTHILSGNSRYPGSTSSGAPAYPPGSVFNDDKKTGSP